MKENISKILKIVILLIIIQVIRIIVRKLLLLFIPTTSLSIMIINMLIFIIYIYLLIKISKRSNIDLRVFKVNNKNSYVLLSIMFLILFIINLFVTKFEFDTLISIIYGIIVTPIFEELLFRGYIWGRINKFIKNELIIYIIVTILFSLWHILYFDSYIMNSKLNGLTFTYNIIMWKIIIGFIFGLVTGFVRYKIKNTYSSMLVHSFMNMFGR